jgi:ABC-2 type transport system permease protein
VTATAYTRLEVLRTFRNRRFFIFSLVFPFVLYLLLAAPNRDETDFLNSGVSAPLYYMVGLIAFGTMVAVIAGGARIAAERSVGWNRQLRLTPLTVPAYFRTKILTGYLMACVSIVLLYAAGIALGLSTRWGPRWAASPRCSPSSAGPGSRSPGAAGWPSSPAGSPRTGW